MQPMKHITLITLIDAPNYPNQPNYIDDYPNDIDHPNWLPLWT